MELLQVIIIIVLLVILLLINIFRIVRPSYSYILERNKKFYKIIDHGIFWVNPFIDKVKCAVNIKSQVIDCKPTLVVSADNKTTKIKINIFFEVIDVKKIGYLEENIEDKLEKFSVKTLCDIIKKINSYEYDHKKIEYILKKLLNDEFSSLGCKINKVEVFYANTSSLVEKQEIRKSYVVNNFINRRLQIINSYIKVFVIYALIALVSLLHEKYYTNNILLFCLFRQVINGIKFIFPFYFVVKVFLAYDKIVIKKIAKGLRMLMVFAIFILFLRDAATSPKRATDSFFPTTILEYNCAIIGDLFIPQTTTIKVKNVSVHSGYGRGYGAQERHKDYYVSCIKYDIYVSEAPVALIKLVDKLIMYEREITIEYYNNSKIIKSIDGIDILNYKEIQRRIDYLKELKKYQVKN